MPSELLPHVIRKRETRGLDIAHPASFEVETMPARSRWYELPAQYVRATTAPAEFSELRVLCSELAERVDELEDMVASLEFAVVDGYFVKIWPEDGQWIVHCPTARCVVQEETREEAVAAIEESIREVLGALADAGVPTPGKDI